MEPRDPRVLSIAVAIVGLFDALAAQRPHGADDELLPLADAARLAASSTRVLRAAIGAGELRAYGRQRDRSVRRGDLARWIEDRRVRVEGVDDPDIARRMRRLRVVRGPS